jgi:ABC-type transport system substrate-binding protein
MDYPADEDWYDNLLETTAEQNYTCINVSQADQLVAQANTMVDPQAAEALYQQAEQLYVNDVAWIVLDQPTDNYIVRPNVIGDAENDSGLAPPEVLLNFFVTT